MRLRDATPDDFPQVLALNAESVRYLSPMPDERLRQLHGHCCLHQVAESSGRVIGFVLAFREGANYDSVNYRWFAQRYHRFVYVDRVVVSPSARGQGVASALYDQVFRHARQSGVDDVVCEFDVDPPNPVSERFHAGFGFTEVGRQRLPSGKLVSLRAASTGLFSHSKARLTS